MKRAAKLGSFQPFLSWSIMGNVSGCSITCSNDTPTLNASQTIPADGDCRQSSNSKGGGIAVLFNRWHNAGHVTEVS